MIPVVVEHDDDDDDSLSGWLEAHDAISLLYLCEPGEPLFAGQV